MHRERTKKQSTHYPSEKSCPSCSILFFKVGTHRFRIQLVSVLRQNLFHTGLFCVCYKAEPPAKEGGERGGRGATHASDKIRMQTHDSSHGKAWKSMRHPVIGRRSAHASFLPRPLGNGIPHHHALLHLAKFAEVLLQALCKHTGEILLSEEGRTEEIILQALMCWQGLEKDNGVGRTTLCLCVPPTTTTTTSNAPETVHRGSLTIQHNSPLGPADHKQSCTLGDARCFDTAEAAAG